MIKSLKNKKPKKYKKSKLVINQPIKSNQSYLQNLQIIDKKDKKKLLMQKIAQQKLHQVCQTDLEPLFFISHHKQNPDKLSPWITNQAQSKDQYVYKSLSQLKYKTKILKSRINNQNMINTVKNSCNRIDLKNQNQRKGLKDYVQSSKQVKLSQTVQIRKNENMENYNMISQSKQVQRGNGYDEQRQQNDRQKVIFRKILRQKNRTKGEDYSYQKEQKLRELLNLKRPVTSYNKRMKSKQNIDKKENLKVNIFFENLPPPAYKSASIKNKQNQRYDCDKFIFYPSNNPFIRNIYKNQFQLHKLHN